MLANRVREFTNTEGTGDITLGGALRGHVRFADAFNAADEVSYVIEDGDNYEIGIGVLVDTDTLSRVSVQETLLAGVYERNTPVAIPLSGNARVFCALSTDYLNRPKIAADVIGEVTPDAGVDIDGVMMKDGGGGFSGPVSIESTAANQLSLLAAGGRQVTLGVESNGALVVDSDGAEKLRIEADTTTLSGAIKAAAFGHPSMQMSDAAGQAFFAPVAAGVPDFVRAFTYDPMLEEWSVGTGFSVAGGLSLDGDVEAAGRLYTGAGNAAQPAVAFNADTDTGLYRVDENSLGFAVGGAEKMRLDGGGMQLAGNANIRNGGGVAASPSFTFKGDNDTGMYRSAEDQIGFSCDGLGRVVVGRDLGVPNGSGLWVNNGASVSLVVGSDSTGTSLGDATTKVGRIAVPHYTRTEEPLALVFALSQENENTVALGGGSTIMNAASRIGFYTASDSTTVAGTLRWQIGPSGNLTSGPGCDILKQTSDEGLCLSGGAATDEGSNLCLLGDAHATDAYDFFFRRGQENVLHYDDNFAGGDGTFRLHKDLRVESSLHIEGDVLKTQDTGNLLLSGSNAANKGANLLMYGDGHSERALDVEFRSGTNPVLTYDHSIRVWNFYSNEIRNVAGFTNAPVVRFENQSATAPEVARFILSASPGDQSGAYLKCTDGSDDMLTIFADGSVQAAGNLIGDGIIKSKATATTERPAASSAGVGARIFDTTLAKPIWSDGSQWIDASGTVV
ncbi:hypothetical protein [Kordiimonas sp.]|uniref:hypothetical protein n=1 Tax=Kordiimonas sp. TaxID=1970157 RepID=UPI003A8ECB9F